MGKDVPTWIRGNSAAILVCTNRIWDASPIEPSVMIEKSASSLWAGGEADFSI
jgi:hypothetical protein